MDRRLGHHPGGPMKEGTDPMKEAIPLATADPNTQALILFESAALARSAKRLLQTADGATEVAERLEREADVLDDRALEIVRTPSQAVQAPVEAGPRADPPVRHRPEVQRLLDARKARDGAWLKKARSTLKLSQSDLAGKLGLVGGSRSVRKYELNERKPSGPVVVAVEALLREGVTA